MYLINTKYLVFTIAIFSIFASCKKGDSKKQVTPVLAAIDTASVFMGNTWIWYKMGSDINRNGVMDSGELHDYYALPEVTFGNNGYYFDTSPLGGMSSKGYWYFAGAGKSVFYIYNDTVNRKWQNDMFYIYRITDSSLIIVDTARGFPYSWNFYRKK